MSPSFPVCRSLALPIALCWYLSSGTDVDASIISGLPVFAFPDCIIFYLIDLVFTEKKKT